MRRILTPVLLMTLLAAALAGCGSRGNTEEPTLRREPVSFPGTEPFTPPAGTDQAGVTPPPNAGGTFPGDTVGLFGGTENQTTCDKAQLVAFLQQDRAKAAAWASVVGIQVEEIPTFVASLTPALLRSDTKVTNHGFKDGRAIEIPAVLQAGTAVLVDVHGAPVTKCFCGNPLKAPPATPSNKFTGPEWPSFSSTNVTVIVPVRQTVKQFVFVEPDSGRSFQRPAGTTGRQDAPATAPAPTTFPTPPTPPAPPATGPATTGSVPPPGVAVPSVTPPAATTPPTGPTTPTRPTSPTATPTSPSPTTSPTASPTPTGSPTSPSPSPTTTGPTSPTATGPTSPTPAALRASWVVGDCFVRSGRAHGTVLVQADSPEPQRFTVRVQLGDRNNPVAVETVTVATSPGQIGRSEVEAPTSTPDGRVQCEILSIVDENGVPPVAGPPLPPPSDSVPMPAQPSPGQTTGPLPTPPSPVVPTPS